MGGHDSVEMQALRTMAWERAKGELRAMLWAYQQDEGFETVNALVEEFIENVDQEVG